MPGLHSSRSRPQLRRAPIDGKLPAFAQHATIALRQDAHQLVPGAAIRRARENHLLAALPLADYKRLLSHLEPLPLPVGWTLHRAGDREQHLYFLTAGIVSRLYVTENGASTEFAVTGNEGVIGIASFLGGESTPSHAVVLSEGHSYRLAAEVLKNEFEHDGPLPQLLLRYTRVLVAQTGQVAVCNRHHSLEQRLCRWILSCLDRLASNELVMTQEVIADMLGVRRESVTAAAGKLQRAGALHCSRGRIAVLDRRRLEAQVCECYAVVKREYDSLLGTGNTRRPAGRHDTWGTPAQCAEDPAQPEWARR